MTLLEIAHWIASLPLLDQLSAFVAEHVLANPSKTGIEGLGYTSSLNSSFNGVFADLVVALVAVSVVVSMVAMVCIIAALWKVNTMYTLTRRQNA